MKNNYKKFLLSIITLIVSFAGFAQLPNPDQAGGGGGDPPAPIDNQLILLAIIGVFFAYFIFSTRNRKA
jgi:hypothetical protein